MSDLISSDRPSGVFSVYFGIVLTAAIAVFVVFRGGNYAALPSIIDDLKTGPFSGMSEFWFAAVRFAFGLCIFGSSVAIGHLIDRAISPPAVSGHSHVLELGRKATIGACIWLIAAAIANQLGLGSVSVAAIAAMVTLPLLFLFARRAREVGEETRVPERATMVDRLLALLLFAMMGLALLAAVAGGTFTAAAMFWAFPVLIMSVFGWARESSISRRGSLFASLAAAFVPALFYAVQVGFRDVLLVLICVFAAICLLRTVTLRSARWAVVLSIFIVAFVAIHIG